MVRQLGTSTTGSSEAFSATISFSKNPFRARSKQILTAKHLLRKAMNSNLNLKATDVSLIGWYCNERNMAGRHFRFHIRHLLEITVWVSIIAAIWLQLSVAWLAILIPFAICLRLLVDDMASARWKN